MKREQLIRTWSEYEKGARPVGEAQTPETWALTREAFYEQFGTIPIPPADAERLEDLRGKYAGERIFVIGNGPSLANTPLEFMRNEFTFGVNRIYIMEDALGFAPNFFTVVDWRVAADCSSEIAALRDRTMFLPERFRGLIDSDADDVYWYHHNGHSDRAKARFSPNAAEGIRGAGSVIGSAIQLAFHMGFERIYMVGCDLTYSVPDTVVQSGPDKFGHGVKLHLTSTKDDDPNHFDPSYFGAGRKWHDPNVPRMFEGYAACQEGVASRGRHLFNATVGGRLESSPRVDIHALLLPSATPRPVIKNSQLGAVADRLLNTSSLTGDGETCVVAGATDTKVLDVLTNQFDSVYLFEPSESVREDVMNTLGSRVGLRIDARFLGPSDRRVASYSDPSTRGLSSIMVSNKSTAADDVAMCKLETVFTSRRVDHPTMVWLGCGANTIDGIVQATLIPSLTRLVVEAGTGTGPDFGDAPTQLKVFAEHAGVSTLTMVGSRDGSAQLRPGLLKATTGETVQLWLAIPDQEAAELVAGGPFARPVTTPPPTPPKSVALLTLAAAEQIEQIEQIVEAATT